MMKQRNYSLIAVKCLGLLLATTALLFGFDNSPVPTQRTGGFGEPTCTLCHTSFPVNSGGGSLTFQGVPVQYIPGNSYPITVRFSQPNRTANSKWGFEAAVRFQNGGGQAGQITAPTDTLLRTDSGNGVQYISHLPNNPGSVRKGNLGPVTWTFTWQAPAPASGPVVFNVAGNAANGDNTSQGDYIYTASQTSNPLSAPTFPNNTYFAQFANGDGITSTLTLTNPGGAPVSAGLSMFADDGSPFSVNLTSDPPVADVTNFTIPPMGSQTFATDGQGALISGSLRVGYNSTISGVVLFSAPGLGVTGVGEGVPLTGALTPAVRNASTGLNTGVAAINLSSASATITLTLHRLDGTILGSPVTRTLAANGHFALFLDALFPGVDTRNFKGSLEIRGGSSTIVAMALRIGGGEFTTLPVAALP